MSLIQQRIAIDRKRVVGLLLVVSGGLGILFGIVLILTDPSHWTRWLSTVPWIFFAGVGIAQLFQYRSALGEFESTHGVGAGKQ